ncbi:MAG: hypothetical protein E6K18_06760 [Methanobacteriota archaeon]|nr:MAG: hypothetical protein E6K18_06760 [Euryarchaeota archaeon]
MGVFDKLKSAGQAMTGGSAKVSIEYPLQTVFPGEPVAVRVTVMSSASGEVKSKGVFVDLLAEEHLNGGNMQCPHCRNSFSPKHDPKKTHEQSVPIAPAFSLMPGETKTFEANVQVPGGAQPTYAGPTGRHEWKVRGRLQTFGNDPDSGFQPLRVGMK